MFGKHHIITQLAGAFAIASVAAVVAVSSAAAGTSSSDRTRGQACQTTATSRHVVTDDQGNPWLERDGLTACTDVVGCTATGQSPTQAPNPGWITVVDDLGIPYLYPIGQDGASVAQACALQAATPAAPAVAPAKATVKKASAKKASAKKKAASMTTQFRHAESVTR